MTHRDEVIARASAIESELRSASARLKKAGWEDGLLERILHDDRVRGDLFRFIDVFPVLGSSAEVAQHLQEYIPDEAPVLARFGRAAGALPFLGPATAFATRASVRHLAAKFIAGETPLQAAVAARKLDAEGFGATIDLLGEAVVSPAEADAYRDRYLALLSALGPRWPGDGPAALRSCGPRKNISIKLSALTSRFHPLDPEDASRRIRERLRPILSRAIAEGIFVHFDMEEHETRDLTFRVIRDLLAEDPFREMDNVGLVLQAYLRDAEAFVTEVLDWIAARDRDCTIRLVRGAYWDAEAATALASGRTPPVWRNRHETDACFHRLLERLLREHRTVRTAVATHNVGSLARALALIEDLAPPSGRWEFQMLRGMSAETAAALRERNLPVRLYLPVGDLVSGIGYLVRRLLENSSNETLLAPARAEAEHASRPIEGWPRPALDHAPLADWASMTDRDAMRRGLDQVRSRLGNAVPVVIGGKIRSSRDVIERRDPSHPSRMVSVCGAAGAADVEAAVAAAQAAQPAWARMPPAERAVILRRAAGLLVAWRWEMAAWEVFEAAKPWREADADVCEAVDHLRYAADQAERIAAGEEFEPEIPGESNHLGFRPRGLVAAITPWNFPAAIPAGVIGPALAAGNAVLFKPAEQTPACAHLLARLLWDAGVPPEILAFLPGRGEEAGAALAQNPAVDMVSFTGSRAVGLRILKATARQGRGGLRRALLELGGKNAIVVDRSADPDEAVRGILASAFDYAGQKCSAASRLILVEGTESLLERLAAAAAARRIGPAEAPTTDIPPLIDEAAVQRVNRYAALARKDGRILHDTNSLPDDGRYAGPLIVRDLPFDSPVMKEEIFGPILAVSVVRSFDDALRAAADSDYALTAGVYSRTPSHVRRAVESLVAGNIYVNRKITGAVVGRHPFGGHRFSGSGEKSGAPDTIKAYGVPVHVSERTVRHGYVWR